MRGGERSRGGEGSRVTAHRVSGDRAYSIHVTINDNVKTFGVRVRSGYGSGGEGGEGGGGGGIGGGGASSGGGPVGGASVSVTIRNTGSHCGGQAAAWTAGRAFELRWPTACGRTTSKPCSTVAFAGQPRISQYSLVGRTLDTVEPAIRLTSVSVLATLGVRTAQTPATRRIGLTRRE